MKQYRYLFYEMTNDDLDGYFVNVDFNPIEREIQVNVGDGHYEWINELASAPITEDELEIDMRAHISFGMTADEAREYIMNRVEEI